jgi:hypothetical protein
MHNESLPGTFPTLPDSGTCESSSRSAANGTLICSRSAIHAPETATPEISTRANTPTSALRQSALLTRFALDLFSEKIQVSSGLTLFAPGERCELILSHLDTLCCHSDSEPVALALSIDGKGCSCSPRYPTPTASDWKGSTGKGSRRGTLAERLAILAGKPGETCYPHPEFVEALMGFRVGWSALLD